MADISVTNTMLQPVNNSASQTQINNRTNIKAFDTPDVAKEDNKSLEASKEAREKLREELLENVISVSEDGDTVQVSDDGSDKLSNTQNNIFDNDIFEEEEPVRISAPDSYSVDVTSKVPLDTDIDLSDENTDKASDQTSKITSFKGYTDTQLEQMYLKGEISKYNYDQEIDARKAQREELQNDNNDTSKEMMSTVTGMERVSQDSKQLQEAFSDDSAATPDAAKRVEIMSALQDFTKLQ